MLTKNRKGYVYIPALILESGICLLTVLKTYQKASVVYKMGSSLFMVLYRDGVAYYVVCIIYITF
jgi:hypothetical protein